MSMSMLTSVIQVCRVLVVYDNLGRSCVVVSILKFSHACGGTLCARTKLGEVEESAVKSVSDVNFHSASERDVSQLTQSSV